MSVNKISYPEFVIVLMAGLMVTSFFGVLILPVVSLIFYAVATCYFLNYIKNEKFTAMIADITIFFGFFTLNGYLLRDVWVFPSSDDTLNHLSFLRSILESNQVFISKIDRPTWDILPAEKYDFYPTGTHALLATILYPLKYFNYNWSNAVQSLLLVILSAWPVMIWRGLRIVFNNIYIRVFITCCLVTTPLFPLFAVGEGSISRVVTMMVFTPLWFHVLRSNYSSFLGFFWFSLALPVFFFFHPMVLPLVGISIVFFDRKNLLGSFFGLPIGLFFMAAILKSGYQPVLSDDIQNVLASGFRFSAASVIDRLKGPLHYWFSDSFGFLKFFSFKSLVIYASVFLTLKNKNYKMLLLMLLPFLLALTVFVDIGLFQKLGLIYYHSVKRISEILPLLSIAIITTALFQIRISLNKPLKVSLVVLSIVYVSIFITKSSEQMQHFNAVFKSVDKHYARNVHEFISKNNIQDDYLVVDDNQYLFASYGFTGLPMALRPDCQEAGRVSTYCKERINLVDTIIHNKMTSLDKTVWVVPSKENKSLRIDYALKNNYRILKYDEELVFVEIYRVKI